MKETKCLLVVTWYNINVEAIFSQQLISNFIIDFCGCVLFDLDKFRTLHIQFCSMDPISGDITGNSTPHINQNLVPYKPLRSKEDRKEMSRHINLPC